MKSLYRKRAPLHILVIGPMPPPYTGTTTLLEYLVEIMVRDSGVEVHVLNTLGVRGRGLTGVSRFVRLVWQSFRFARSCDIVTVHCSTTALHIMGFTALLIARLAGRPLIIRKFAGDDYATTLGAVGRRAAEFALKHADLYLAESKLLVNQARERGIPRVDWYPNSRPVPDKQPVRNNGPCSHFVYVGRVIEGKGMRVLAAASKELPSGATVDIYGPWGEDLERTLFDDCPNVTYHGPLKPEDIVPTMGKYDASLLPTHYRGEGYPGAVLESYLAGLPVIATRWRALPEIIDETVGILVEPRNPAELARAMTRLLEDEALFQSLRANTRAKAVSFSAEHWGEYFIELCRNIAEKNPEESPRGR